MMENTPVSVPYGNSELTARVPGEVRLLLANHADPPKDQVELVADALDHPTGSPPLADLARGRKSAVILISCRTRRTGSPVFLPEIVKRLNAAGIADSAITVVTATGTHENFRTQDAELLLGADIARRVRFEGHDCRTPDALQFVGETPRGTRVLMSRRYLESDLKIACGRVTYHYFAGFTAGRKTILPGVSSFDTVEQNHSMAVLFDGEPRINPDTRNGNLDTNPIHLDMLDAARMAPPGFTLCTVLNTRKQMTGVFGGDMEAAHLAAVDVVRRADAPVAPEPADWLVLSSGGAPSDVNTIQAIKALINTYHAVRKGGAIIFCAECAEGSPEWLLRATALRDLRELQQRIGTREFRKGHNALWIWELREHAHVIMVSALPQADVDRLGFRAAASLQEAVTLAESLTGAPRLVYSIPHGNLTVPNGGPASR